MKPLEAILSIHDVVPETLERVGELVEAVGPMAGSRVCLLVVPGREWRGDQLDRLRRWAEGGLEIAGHGWVHRGPPRSLYHRVHGLLLSRDQAEHLSRTRDELRALVERGFGWFASVGLPAPELYVPPAWALGRLGPADLRGLPYRWYEVLTGYTEAGSGHHHRVPLVGFEADTAFRQRALRLNNGLQEGLARAWGRPLRIGLHPHDLHLRLADDVLPLLGRCQGFLTTAEALAPPGGAPRIPG